MRGKINYFRIVIAVLMVSLFMNVFLSINRYVYKSRALKSAYSDMRNIKEKVNINLEIVENIIENKGYSGKEILNLYDNFSVMTKSMIDLWDDYNFYSDKSLISIGNIESKNVLDNDVFFRIEEYMKNTLMNTMTDNKTNYKSTEKEIADFQKIQALLSEIKDVFKGYDENQLKGLEGDAREKAVIENDYWVEMLDKINEINKKFSDYDFSKDNLETKNIA